MAKRKRSRINADRRTFLKDCTLLAPGCALLGSMSSLFTPGQASAGTTGDLVYGKSVEAMFCDGDSCIYLVEIASGEQAVGLGPSGLSSWNSWQAPGKIGGQLPSIICHPGLSPAAKSSLQSRLAELE